MQTRPARTQQTNIENPYKTAIGPLHFQRYNPYKTVINPRHLQRYKPYKTIISPRHSQRYKQGQLERSKPASKPIPYRTTISPLLTSPLLSPPLLPVRGGKQKSKGASLKFSAKILDNFAYEFDRGDRIGIVGGNGVGKTTFLNVLMGAQPLDSGEVKTGGTVRQARSGGRGGGGCALKRGWMGHLSLTFFATNIVPTRSWSLGEQPKEEGWGFDQTAGLDLLCFCTAVSLKGISKK